jgi:hypothetical protein
MTQPVVLNTIPPGPSGSARAGALTGFANLGPNCDQNFIKFSNWAAQLRASMAPVVFPGVDWFGPAGTWTPQVPDCIGRRQGRLANVHLTMAYTGNIVSTATGDVSPDLLMGTIIETVGQPTMRPVVSTILTASGYTGVGCTASLRLDPDGRLFLTGLSCAITAVNPGFCFTASWLCAPAASLPLP